VSDSGHATGATGQGSGGQQQNLRGILPLLQELCRICKFASSQLDVVVGRDWGSRCSKWVFFNVDCSMGLKKFEEIPKKSYLTWSRTYSSSWTLTLCSVQPQGCLHLLKKDVFVQLLNFLLGPSPKNNGDLNQQQREKLPRRWSSNQVREFGPLHTTIAFLVRSTDFSMFESEADTSETIPLNPYMVPAKRGDLENPSDGMHQALFTIDNSKRFIREVGVSFQFGKGWGGVWVSCWR